MSKPVAVTSEIDPRNKKFVLIKLCYISKHPGIKETFWYTKIQQRIKAPVLVIADAINSYRFKYNIPYLQNIKRGEIVSALDKKRLQIKVGCLF